MVVIVVHLIRPGLAEVILAVLLPNFKFELSDKPIVWNHASVMYPTVGAESQTPEMPLKISLVHR